MVGIGVILLRRRDETFLVGLRQGSHGAGEWAFPGGKLDPGETPEQCAARELGEEAGIWLPAQEFRRVPVWTNDLFPADDRHFLTVYLIADAPEEVEAVVCEPEKCAGWLWPRWDKPPAPLFNGIRELQAEYPTFSDLAAI